MPTITIAGRAVLIDEEDEHLIETYRWTIGGGSGRYYVRSNPADRKSLSGVLHLHRLIMNCPNDLVVDHINGNGLDNRKINLRICSQAENLRNRKTHSNNSSGFKGVYFDPRNQGKHWRAQIRVDGKKINLGRFDTAEEAHAAYCTASARHHGRFARTA